MNRSGIKGRKLLAVLKINPVNAFAEKCDNILRFLSDKDHVSWRFFYFGTDLRQDDALVNYLVKFKEYVHCDEKGIALTKMGRNFISVTSFVNERDKLHAMPVNLLSNAEMKVMYLITKGKSYKDACDELNISINTVKKHLKSVYRKLEANSRKEAVVKFLQVENPLLHYNQFSQLG